MFRTFRRSWELVKISWGVLQQDRELLMFPLLALVGSIIVSIIYGIALFASGFVQMMSRQGDEQAGTTIIGIIVLFIYYLINYTIITFSNVALTGAVLMRFNGEDPTVSDGFQIASGKLGKIVGYAAINATIGVLLSLIRGNARESKNIAIQIVASIVAGLIEGVWAVVTYLVIPVLVAENVGPIDAIKRSGSLVRDTWGRQLAGEFSMGAIFGLLSLAVILVIGVPIFALATSMQSIALGVIGGIIVLVLVLGINLVGGALNSIFRLALYRYAHDQKVEYFDEAVIRGAFVPSPA